MSGSTAIFDHNIFPDSSNPALFLQKITHLNRQKGFTELPRALFWCLLCSESACHHYLSSGKTIKYFTASTQVIHKFRLPYHRETTILYKVHVRCKTGSFNEKALVWVKRKNAVIPEMFMHYSCDSGQIKATSLQSHIYTYKHRKHIMTRLAFHL